MKLSLRVLAVIVIILSLSVAAFSLYSLYHRPFDVRYLDVRFSVGSSVGVEVNKSALTFGKILPDTAATREVFIDNPYEFPVTVAAFIDPSLQPYITMAEPVFTLQPFEHRAVSFTLRAPSDAAFDNYSGSLRFEFRR